jgi:hypothetical protein
LQLTILRFRCPPDLAESQITQLSRQAGIAD